MKTPIRLAISTCPNDTFAFHAILNQKIDFEGLDFAIELLDIEELNCGLSTNRFDVGKASFSSAIPLADRWYVLPSGSALGFGVGPLLLAAISDTWPNDPGQITLCPGENTTATLLFRMFYGCTRIEHARFSEIMPALQKNRAHFGVCIHEGRFTWQDAGLFLVDDLGTRWESESGCPLPLGGILARRSLASETLRTIQKVVKASIQYGLENRDETLPTLRRYAQELNDSVLKQHVELYVNQWTVDLGPVGANALRQLSKSAEPLGIHGLQPLQIFEG